MRSVTEEQKAAALDPKDYLPHLILGRIFLVLKGEKEGAEEAQQAYDINPFACSGFLNFANKDRLDRHRWFVQANYWKEMAAAERTEPKAAGVTAQPPVVPESAGSKNSEGNSPAPDKKAPEPLDKAKPATGRK